MSLRGEVVAIGDELLSGARVNANAAWIGTHLDEVGVRVVHGTVVGDDIEGIASALRSAASRSDVVVVTGGLGPTDDDRTRDALAALLGAALVRDVGTEARIVSWYSVRGRTPADEVLRQADVPVGVRPLLNEVGTAPGLRAELDGAVVVCLPGVPAEMRAIMLGSVLPELRERAGGAGVAIATLRTALTPESVVAAAIRDVEARAAAAGVAVAYLPSIAEVVVRFVGREAGARDRVAAFADEAAALLGDVVAVRGDGSLAEEVVRLARASGTTLAVAESLTGGSVGAAITDVAGASAVLRGVVVPYATDLKHDLLGVDDAVLESVGAVDAEVARQMAVRVRERLGADLAVATTGVAGPDPQDGHPPGTVHVAVAGPTGVVVVSPRLAGDRARVRAATVVHALDLVRRSLTGLPPAG